MTTHTFYNLLVGRACVELLSQVCVNTDCGFQLITSSEEGPTPWCVNMVESQHLRTAVSIRDLSTNTEMLKYRVRILIILQCRITMVHIFFNEYNGRNEWLKLHFLNVMVVESGPHC